MNQTLTFNVQLTTIHCGVCGGIYAINERYRRQKEEKSGMWNCPYCKTSWGYVEGENARLKKELARKQADLDQTTAAARDARDRADALERSRNAVKGQLTKAKKRIGKGVCPCCNRFFKELSEHMKTQHPMYAELETQ